MKERSVDPEDGQEWQSKESCWAQSRLFCPIGEGEAVCAVQEVGHEPEWRGAAFRDIRFDS